MIKTDEELKEEELYNKLIEAIDEGNKEEVQRLINEGVYVNKLDENIKTPLIISIEKGKDEIAKLLLDNGAYVDLPVMSAMDYKMHSALYSAVSKGNYDMVEELIKRGANLNVGNQDYDLNKYKLPLRLAIENGYDNIAKLLIENGAKYDKIDKTKCSEEIKKVIAQKEKEKEDNRQKIINELKEEINNDAILKEKFKSKNWGKVVQKYVDRKMGVNINLEELSSDELDDLLILNNYRKEKNKESRRERKQNEEKNNKAITEDEIKEYVKNNIPVCIRAISGAGGMEQYHEDTAMGQNRNKTGIETEIDKLVREENEETNTHMKGEKKGNPNRSVTMINYGKVTAFRSVGYGFIGDNLKNIHLAASEDINSQYSKKRNGLVMHFNRILHDYNMPIEKQINKVLKKLEEAEGVGKHNELLMDVSDKDVRFVFWSEIDEESVNCSKLKAVYFRKKFYEQTGKELPIFQYKPGEMDYVKETNFTKEEVIDMLKNEIIEEIAGENNSKTYRIKAPYDKGSALNFLMAFKDEIDNITFDNDKKGEKKIIQTILEEFIQKDVEFYSKKENVENIHEVVNLIKFAGMVKGKDYQEKVFKSIFEGLDLNKIIVDFLKTSDRDWTNNNDVKRENRNIDFAIEIMSDIRSLVTTDESIKMLEGKLKEVRENINREFLLNKVYKGLTSYYAISDNDAKKVVEYSSKYSEFKEFLVAAAKEERISVVRKLIENGADINAVNKDGKTALMIAKEQKNDDLVDYLIENGAKEMEVDNEKKEEGNNMEETLYKSTDSIDISSNYSEKTLSPSKSSVSINSDISDVTLTDNKEINTGVNVKSMINKFEEISKKTQERNNLLKKIDVNKNSGKVGNKVGKEFSNRVK